MGVMAGHDHSHQHDHDHSHGHGHSHGHQHGNEADRGIRAMLRYARFAREMWRSDMNEAVVARLAPTAGETVVDIGAGVGAGTVVAAGRGADVIAVEPTPYMRRILGWRRLGHRSRDRIAIVDGAAEATGLEAASVDGAWAVNTMHHWTDVASGTAELARILAPGGRVVLADEDFEDPAHPDHERFTARHDSDHGHAFHMVDAAEIAELLRAAGLEVVTAGKEELAGAPVIVIEATKPAT